MLIQELTQAYEELIGKRLARFSTFIADKLASDAAPISTSTSSTSKPKHVKGVSAAAGSKSEKAVVSKAETVASVMGHLDANTWAMLMGSADHLSFSRRGHVIKEGDTTKALYQLTHGMPQSIGRGH